jgi:DNA-binding NarL/FixJ family response regulator
MTNKFTNVLIVDDHPMIIESYVSIISSKFKKYNLKFEKATTCETALNVVESFILRDEIIDFVILDLSLPPCEIKEVSSGLDLGLIIKSKFPKCKIIIITHHTEGFLLHKVFKELMPNGFINKADIDITNFEKIFNNFLNGETFVSETINKSILSFNENHITLDEIDFKIIELIEKGVKTKELTNYIDLSLSAIEKRKAKMKFYFANNKINDKELIERMKVLNFS